MTKDDAKEACRLLFAAGTPKEEITPETLLIADALIKETNRQLATRLVEKLFPEWSSTVTGIGNHGHRP